MIEVEDFMREARQNARLIRAGVPRSAGDGVRRWLDAVDGEGEAVNSGEALGGGVVTPQNASVAAYQPIARNYRDFANWTSSPTTS